MVGNTPGKSLGKGEVEGWGMGDGGWGPGWGGGDEIMKKIGDGGGGGRNNKV